jgi:phosphoglucosamine mutase
LQKKKYFGTDGIRGRVGSDVVNASFMLKLGWAVGRVLVKQEGGGKVVIGKDTRISGYMFESALEAGLSAAGVDIRLLGPMPTPAIAYLTRSLHAQAGIVISASHNPYYDNGIKFFSAQGSKLPDDVELAIEAELEKPMLTVDSSMLGKAERVDDAARRYIEFCKNTLPAQLSLKGMKIVVDCAHGAAYHIAPIVFEELGAEVLCIGVEPDGLNINADCGSTQPETMRNTVLAHDADLGIALDGDGDRLIMADHTGQLLDGDELLFIIAQARQRDQTLRGTVVGTVMSNLGLEHALKSKGIALQRTPVGDRYVLEMLQQNDWILGGENSGHIICLDCSTTGDAIIAALQILAAMSDAGQSLHDIKAGMTKYPQCMINVSAEKDFDLDRATQVQHALHDAESQLAGNGRVLLRCSGTEPLVRVMVEGTDAHQVETLARHLASVVSNSVALHTPQP